MSKELELLEGISKKMDDTKASQEKELKKLQEQYELEKKATEEKVADLNKQLGEKGATIAQVQEEIKELKAKDGRIAMKGFGDRKTEIKQMISDVIAEKGNNLMNEIKKIDEKSGKEGLEIKSVANITSANLATSNYISYLPADAGQRPFGQTRFRSFVSVIQTDTDFVQFPRQNTPVGEGSFGRQTTEGSDKAQVDYDWTMIDVTLTPLAGYATVSRQSLRNIKFLQSYLPMNLMEDLEDTEDLDYGNALVAAATGSTTSTGSNEIEKLVHYIRNLGKNKFMANNIAVDFDTWTDIILTTQTNAGYNLPNVVTVDSNGTVRILGRPVNPVNWLTGGRVLVGDWRKCAIIESEGLTMRQTDSHDTNFTKNMLTFLLERTSKLAIFRPDAFVTAVI